MFYDLCTIIVRLHRTPCSLFRATPSHFVVLHPHSAPVPYRQTMLASRLSRATRAATLLSRATTFTAVARFASSAAPAALFSGSAATIANSKSLKSVKLPSFEKLVAIPVRAFSVDPDSDNAVRSHQHSSTLS